MPGIAPARWFWITITLIVAGVAIAVPAALALRDERAPSAATRVEHAPPDRTGYFRTAPVGSWSRLPTEAACARSVHRSTWEPRPANAAPNHRTFPVDRVHHSLAVRPVAVESSYDKRWDRWLLARVTGHHTGTTDEILQWAACKWGIADNVLRAVAVRESTWFQALAYTSGACVTNFGCGDWVTRSTSATTTFCASVARLGLDGTVGRRGRAGVCPRTFGIVGVMSWQDPRWGRLRGNQNGTFPFNQQSTAFAADYLASQLRGCYEGWEWWLRNTGTRDYRAGDLWGCVGAWYSGDWHSATANGYVSRVRQELARRQWLDAGWAAQLPPCSAVEGCPRGAGHRGP